MPGRAKQESIAASPKRSNPRLLRGEPRLPLMRSPFRGSPTHGNNSSFFRPFSASRCLIGDASYSSSATSTLLDCHRSTDALFNHTAVERAREHDPTTIRSGRPGFGAQQIGVAEGVAGFAEQMVELRTVRLSYARVLIARPPPAPASVGAGGRTATSCPRSRPTVRTRPWPGAIARRACHPPRGRPRPG